MDEEKKTGEGLYWVHSFYFGEITQEHFNTWDEANARFEELKLNGPSTAIYLYIDGQLDKSWEDSYLGYGLMDDDEDGWEEDDDYFDEEDPEDFLRAVGGEEADLSTDSSGGGVEA